MATASERFGRFLNMVEARWSLYALVQGSGIVASFSLPAWAVRSAAIFSQYAPFSWVAAGFLGVLFWAVVRLIWQWGTKIRVRAKYDAKFLEAGSNFNPLDLTFERKRILLNDFALPSWTVIEGKTFIDCDLIGPACIYFSADNQANPIRPPKFDAVWLDAEASFNNGFLFTNCIFRNCSFQRITMFASIENYHDWKDNPMVNWISIPPEQKHLERRAQVIRGQHAAQASMRLAREAREAEERERAKSPPELFPPTQAPSDKPA